MLEQLEARHPPVQFNAADPKKYTGGPHAISQPLSAIDIKAHLKHEDGAKTARTTELLEIAKFVYPYFQSIVSEVCHDVNVAPNPYVVSFSIVESLISWLI